MTAFHLHQTLGKSHWGKFLLLLNSWRVFCSTMIIQVNKKRVLPLSTLERNHGCNNTLCHGLPELYIVLAPVVQKM